MKARIAVVLVVFAALGALAWAIGDRLLEEWAGEEEGRGGERGGRPPAPVEVAPIASGPVEERLAIAGSLLPSAEYVVAPKVAGRLVELNFDVGDAVARGAVIARLDDEAFRQAVAEAEAAVAVAEARVAEAKSTVGVARRRAERAATLVDRGVEAEAEHDRAEAERLAAEAAVGVAEAQREQARAEFEAARIRLADTTIVASWAGGDDERVVGERWVDVGDTLAVGERMCSVLEIAPLKGLLHVTEGTYARIAIDQAATLRTDAYPGEEFPAAVARVAPRFNPASRQARVELRVPNADARLKPGMFVRASLILGRVESATLVPEAALVTRGGEPSVFVVAEGADVATRVPVEVGLRGDGVVQVTGEALVGRVVTLGQHLVVDGGEVVIAGVRE